MLRDFRLAPVSAALCTALVTVAACSSSSNSGNATGRGPDGGTSEDAGPLRSIDAGSPYGTGTFTGSLDGKTMTVKGAFSTTVPPSSTDPSVTPPKGTAGLVVLTDGDALCADAPKDQAPAGSQVLFLQVFSVDASGTATPPAATGTYTLAKPTKPGNYASITFYPSGAICMPGTYVGIVPEGTNAATVTLDAIATDGSYAGTFDISYASGVMSSNEHATGQFATVACAGLSSLKPGTATCM